jgi:hypothetical protein
VTTRWTEAYLGVKNKVVPLCKHHTMKLCDEMEVKLHRFSILALEGDGYCI